MSLAVVERANLVARKVLKRLFGRRSGDPYLTHVADIEEPHLFAYSRVLRDYARVLNRHLPSGEFNYFPAKADVLIIERGFFHRTTPFRRAQLLTVFEINIATVIGPTPPGTGVIADATGATSS